MIIRDYNNNLIIINILDYKYDFEYYQAIFIKFFNKNLINNN